MSSALLSHDDFLDSSEIIAEEEVEDEDVEVEAMDEPAEVGDDCVIHVIDIRESLYNLRKELELKLGQDLSGRTFWLQDHLELSDNSTLSEQCEQGVERVQVNLAIKKDKIIIIDVIKPYEEDALSDDQDFSPPPQRKQRKKETDVESKESPQKSGGEDSTVTEWEMCKEYRQEQIRLNIPENPAEWSRSHVSHWIKWALETFPMATIREQDWQIDGKELCALTQETFKLKVPKDPSSLMWTHLELLRHSTFVAKPRKYSMQDQLQMQSEQGGSGSMKVHRKTQRKAPVRLGAAKFTVMSESALGNRTGNNGQVQLWQFLLELLTEKQYREVIHWIGDEGEFKLEKPEAVARLWGERKNKPSMSYEKLSRALRYYYDGDMICKVHSQKFVYKFKLDLKELIGYSAAELNRLVVEAEMKTQRKMF